MSTYHLMRNFVALLRTLGYSRFVSLENFRKPNFPLMADILCYLLKRFDSSLDIQAKIDTEQERLAFVRSTAQIMVSKAHLDINTKKLYMADVNSVPEMLKLAKLIYDAWRALKANNFGTITEEGDSEMMNDNMESKSEPVNGFDKNTYNNFKTSQLISEILESGTQLYDLLADEDQIKAQRQQVLGKQIVIEQIESTMRASIQQLQAEMGSMQDRKEGLDQDSEDLNLKIEKKFTELNRNRKRLQTLYSQRPAFMDELEKVEQDIVQLYDTYVVNSRCLYFLEQKLEEFEEAEKQKLEERNEEIKQMLEQMRVDEFLKEGKNIRGLTNGESHNGVDDDDDELAMLADDEVDIPSDDGEGSDISDAMARDQLETTKNKMKQPGRQKQPVKKSMNDRKLLAPGDKKDPTRSLLANTVVVKPREPRSSKTARIYTYGSSLAGDDEGVGQPKQNGKSDDDEEEEDDDDISKSEALGKMTDSEIDLDAIDSDVDSDNVSANLNLSDDFAPTEKSSNGLASSGILPTRSTRLPIKSNNNISNAAKLTTKFSFDKSDDNF